MALSEQHLADLGAGLSAIAVKRFEIDLKWAYYNDSQAPVWVNSKMRELFESLDDRFSLNLCKLAINTPLNRLWVESWNTPEYDQKWKSLYLDREQKRIYKHAMVAGESYVIGWKNSTAGEQASFNDARTTHLFYDIEDPKTKRVGVKIWEELDGTVRANLYYAERVVRMVADTNAIKTNQKAVKETDLYKAGVGRVSAHMFDYDYADPGGDHELGEPPIWRFAPDLWTPYSLLDDLIPIQDVINKLRSNKMVAAEAGAFPQRLYLTIQELDPKKLAAEPSTALVLDPGDKESPTKIHQFDAMPLDNYDESIDAEVERFFTVAHLPRHLLVGRGANPSGDAVRSDEGPFTEMVRDIATNFGYTWTDMMHALVGDDDKWDKPEWQDARINSNESQAREFKMLVEANMPPAYAAAKAFGWSVDEAEEKGLKKELEQPVTNLSDRSPAPPRTATTEDEPQ